MLRCRFRCRLRHLFIVFLLSLFALSSAAGAAELSDGQKKQQVDILYAQYRQQFKDVAEISPDELLQLLAEKDDLVLIDTRDKEEMAVSTLPGAITQDDFLQHPDRYLDRYLVAYCTIGYRSGVLGAEMIDKGIVIHNLKGGILGWIHAGGDLVHNGSIVNRVHVYGRKWDLAPAKYETVHYSFFRQLF